MKSVILETKKQTTKPTSSRPYSTPLALNKTVRANSRDLNKEKKLNIELYKIIDLVEKRDRSQDVSNSKEKTDILKGSSVIKLGKVSNLERFITDQFGKTIRFFKQLETGEELGFSEKNYKAIINIAQEIIEIGRFNRFTNFEFIEKAICDWSIESHINQKIKEEPITYIERLIDKEKQEFTFYFPTNALHIENPFFIGECEIIHIDDNFIDQRKNTNDKNLNGNTNRALNLLENRIVFKTNIHGTYDFALSRAKRQVNLHASALKIFLINELNSPFITVFELEFNSYITPRFTSFSESSTKRKDLTCQLETNLGAVPTELTVKKIEEIEDLGFSKINSFLAKPQISELQNYIRELITSAGHYASQHNPYERNVMMISWFESIFITPENGKSKGLTKLKKNIIPKFISEEERDLVEKIFIHQYKIRDRYLHNGLEIRIDDDYFYKFHYLPIIMIKKIISLTDSIKTRNELLEYFEKN